MFFVLYIFRMLLIDARQSPISSYVLLLLLARVTHGQRCVAFYYFFSSWGTLLL